MHLARSPVFPNDFPVQTGHALLGVVTWPTLLSIAPFRGCTDRVNAALLQILGIELPATGTWIEVDDHRLLWSGRGQYLLITDGGHSRKLAAALAGLAALVDQTDGWAGLSLTGQDAKDVMARLCSLDLGEDAFAAHAVARTEISHMPGLLQRREEGFEMWVPASFARFLLREARHAMALVAARRTLV